MGSCSSKNKPTWKLHKALKNGTDRSTVSKLLKKGASVTIANVDMETALHLAAYHNQNADVLELLLEAGADLQARDKLGRTPLLIGIIDDRTDVVRVLLAAGASVTAEYQEEKSALHLASSGETAELLLKKGADVNAADKDGNAPLHIAVRRARLSVVLVLLRNKANIEARNALGRTAIHLTDDDGHHPFEQDLNIVKLLAEQGADVNAADSDGLTPLHWAAKATDACDKFVDFDIQHVKALLNNPGCIHDYFGLQHVKVLLDNGADIHATDNRNRTPLHYSVLRGEKTEITALLLKKGADIRTTDQKGDTPLHLANEDNRKVIHNWYENKAMLRNLECGGPDAGGHLPPDYDSILLSEPQERGGGKRTVEDI